MKKMILTAGLVFLLVLLFSIVIIPYNNQRLGDYQCPANSTLIYFYHNGCGACTAMEPLINELPGKGCSVNKLDVETNPAEVMAWDVMFTPTMIICGEKHVGAVSPEQLKTIINNSCS